MNISCGSMGDDSVMKFNGVVVLGNRIGAQNIKNRNGLLYTDLTERYMNALANENILDMQGITEAVSKYFYSNGDSLTGSCRAGTSGSV